MTTKQNHVMVSYAALETNYINTLNGIGVVKGFCRQSFFQSLNEHVYGEYQQRIFDLGFTKLRLTSLASLAGLIIQMAILTYAGNMVFKNQLKIGELMAILALTSAMLPSISNLALLAIPYTEAKIALNRLFEFVDLSPEEPLGQIIGEDEEFEIRSLEFNDVSFRFPGRPKLLRGISVTAERGEIIGIVGASGLGKSTLLHLVERTYLPAEGSISINRSINIGDISLAKWRNAVATVPQDVHLFNGTVIDNILLGREYSESMLMKLIEIPLLQKFVSSLSHGLNTLVGNGGVSVSGGQRQWIGLLRALYVKPDLMLLDEVTAAMDYQNELDVIELLNSLRSQMIIVFVSHRLHTLPQLCDRTYILGDCGIIAEGAHADLLKTSNIYSHFWNSMAGAQRSNLTPEALGSVPDSSGCVSNTSYSIGTGRGSR